MSLGTPIAEGNTAEIFLYQDTIIKIFKDHLPDTEAEREANKQTFAYASGLFVPQIVRVEKINGKQAIVMEYVKGKTLGEMLLANPDQAAEYLELSIQVQQDMHRLKADTLEPMQEKLKRQIMQAPLLSENHKKHLAEKLAAMQFESSICHGDFHLFNVIQADKGLAIIDWVDASAGDIRADVYRSYLLYTQFSPDLAEQYLKLYCKQSGLAKEEILEWAPIIAGARLAETVASENSDRLLEIVYHYCPSFNG